MTFVRVTGGTNAGWRNPFNGPALPWQCACIVTDVYEHEGVTGQTIPMVSARSKTNPGYLARCTSCGTRRPS